MNNRQDSLHPGATGAERVGTSRGVARRFDPEGRHVIDATFGEVPLVTRGGFGLLTARAWPVGRSSGQALPLRLSHRLVTDGAPGLCGLLEATLEWQIPADGSSAWMIEFATSLAPTPAIGTTVGELPLSFNGAIDHAVLRRMTGGPQAWEADMFLGCPGQNAADFVAHYLEPGAIEDAERTTPAPLLIPLVSWHQPQSPLRAALFASPERAWRFAYTGTSRGTFGWTMRMRVEAPPSTTLCERAWLALFEGRIDTAWGAFHRHARHDDHPPIGWLREVRAHYYDFLSPGDDGRRGGGYDLDAPHFKAFGVGLATQHGYYPFWGDYIHPSRHEWQAMRGDVGGRASVSLNDLRRRCQAARDAGARAGIYIHAAGFDSASPLWPALADCAERDEATGAPSRFPWEGPDIAETARHMSIAAEPWADHLLQQVQWIMELIGPDAIVVDETFAGLGYDGRGGGALDGPRSIHMIRWLKRLRALVRSFGEDRAVLSSDCGLAGFSMWCDAEGGDHAYPQLLGLPQYRAAPARYRAALGDKPWLPCAWQCNRLWDEQLDLARATGAAVGLSNGWIEYTGLTGLEALRRARMLGDLTMLRQACAGSQVVSDRTGGDKHG